MKRKILVAEDCEGAAHSLAFALERDYDVTALCGCDGILPALASQSYEMLVINIGMLRGRCGNFLGELMAANPKLIVMTIGKSGAFDLAHEAILSGAAGYFSLPFDSGAFSTAVKNRLPPDSGPTLQEEPPWQTSTLF